MLRRRPRIAPHPSLRALFAGLLVWLAAYSPLRAHDRYEIWTIALLHPGHLELALTMAQATAVQLIDPEGKLPPLTPQNFAAHRARFEQAARGFVILTSNRKLLVPQKVAAELTEENDLVIHLAYPRPAPGRLHVHAAMLKQLGQGYGGLFDASESSGQPLGWEMLSFQNPNLEVTIPAAPAAPAPKS